MSSNSSPDSDTSHDRVPSAGQPTRVTRDSLGEIHVPAEALWGAQTQRAVQNFRISGVPFDRRFLRALGLVKQAAAGINKELGTVDLELARAIETAAAEVAAGRLDSSFPIDVFQTGSGTSTNMNANEVIASRANQILGHPLGAGPVHANDHVNSGQSSNDVIPTAIHVAAALALSEELVPALDHLAAAIRSRAEEVRDHVTTGRTHLMDATPVTLGQVLGSWARQIEIAGQRLRAIQPELLQLPIGGTAVGTGLNAPAGFGKAVAARLAALTGIPFEESSDHFFSQSSSDTPVAVSALVKVAAVAMTKVASDLRWMNSGPHGGLAELTLPALQPGSSIMPGKVNPVIPEAVLMVCAQVIGNDVTITLSGQSSNFQLSVMQPVIAKNLIESIAFLAGAAQALADLAVAGMVIHTDRMAARVERNPILVTALNPVIGYDKAALIAKKAYAENRPIKAVAREMTDLSDEDLDRLLDPRSMT